MPLFEVVIVELPKKTKDGELEKLIAGPSVVIAKDEQAAAIEAVLLDDEVKKADRSRLQVLVRPFM